MSAVAVSAEVPIAAVALVAPVAPPSPLDEIVDDVRLRVAHPVDFLEIAAVLESIGVTDAVARDDYAATDTFDLAGYVFDELAEPRGDRAGAPASVSLRVPSHPAIADALRGTLALVPLVALGAVFLALARDGWSSRSVAALGAGMSIAMLPTGGFMQAVLRRTSIYLGFDDRGLAARFALRGSIVGFTAAVALAGAVVVAFAAAGWLTPSEQLLVTVGAVAFAGFWLPAAALMVAEAGRWIVYALAAGAVCAVASAEVASVEGGLLVGYGVALGALFVGASRAYGPDVLGRRRPLPPLWATVFELRPYFAFGVLLMALLAAPYALAWIAVTPDGVTRLEAVQSLGAAFTFGLVPLLLATGAAERTLRLFWFEAHELQEATAAAETRNFRRELLRFHGRRLVAYGVVNAVLVLVAYGVFATLLWLDVTPALFGPTDPTTVLIFFAVALFSFWQLGVGQFNCMVLISLGHPRPPLRAVRSAVIALAVVGVPLTFVGYELTPLAFLVGTAVFALLSLRACLRALARADYHYATAF